MLSKCTVSSFSAKKVKWTLTTTLHLMDTPPEKAGGQKTMRLKSVASWKQQTTYSMSGTNNNSAYMESVSDQEPYGTSAEGELKEKAEAPMQSDGSDLDDDEDEKEIEKEKEEDDQEKVKVANGKEGLF